MWNDVRPRLGFSRSRQAIATARAEARSAPYRLDEARRVTAVAAVLAAPAPPASSSLAERLRALVLTYCGSQEVVLECEFLPGGRLHGVGIASPLWCSRCGHPRIWHDVAAAARIVARDEVPPLLRETV